MTKVELINKIRNNRSFDLRASEFYEPFDISDEAIKDMADDFYYLLKDVLNYLVGKEEPVSEDLEEEIGKYCSNPENFITYIDVGFKQSPIKKDDIPLIIKAIKFGANWQKEQMIKDADDYIVDDDNTIKRFYDTGGVVGKPIIFGSTPDSINVGDHVKVIVIKEE